MGSAVATTSVASERSPIQLARSVAGPDTTIIAAPAGSRRMLGWLEDAGWLLLLALAFPLVILIVGAPVALVVRLLIEIGRRWL